MLEDVKSLNATIKNLRQFKRLYINSKAMAIGIIVCRFVSDYTYHCSIIYRLKEMIDLLSSLETRVVGHMVV